MSDAVTSFGGLFGDAASPIRVAQPALTLPSVAVLCTTSRGAAVASALALALARACDRPFGIAAAVGLSPTASGSLLPSAARAAAQLRRQGHPAHARGRLVWLADRRAAAQAESRAAEPAPGTAKSQAQAPEAQAAGAAGSSEAAAPMAADPAAAAAALSSELLRASSAVAAPCALAIPFARSAALDRVLAWHDAVVVVRAPDASVALLQVVLASVAALDRPVVAVSAPGRLAAAGATAGIHVPAFATAAISQLGIGGRSR